MADILAKARAGRTVLKRTTSTQGGELPRLVLYMEWLAGENKRRVIDTEGKEHRLNDRIVESSYRLVTGGQAEELMAQHWPAQLGDAAPAKVAKAKPAPAKAAAKPAAAKPASKPAAKPAAAKRAR
ncbi:MAG: hypothetical protein ACAI38_08045 [Myxococcota bacterium]